MKTEIDIYNGADKVIDSFYENIKKYKEPIFICNYTTRLKFIHLKDGNNRYFWEPDISNSMIDGKIFGVPFIVDNKFEDGLFLIENRYKENNE
jgi:HK97 family phage major capsid protein